MFQYPQSGRRPRNRLPFQERRPHPKFQYPQSGRRPRNHKQSVAAFHVVKFQYPQSGRRPRNLSDQYYATISNRFQYPQSGRRPRNQIAFRVRHYWRSFSTLSRVVDLEIVTTVFRNSKTSGFSTLSRVVDLEIMRRDGSESARPVFQYPQSGRRPRNKFVRFLPTWKS